MPFTPAARTAIRTCCAPACGSSTSTTRSTSGPPYSLKRDARIFFDPFGGGICSSRSAILDRNSREPTRTRLPRHCWLLSVSCSGCDSIRSPWPKSTLLGTPGDKTPRQVDAALAGPLRQSGFEWPPPIERARHARAQQLRIRYALVRDCRCADPASGTCFASKAEACACTYASCP